MLKLEKILILISIITGLTLSVLRSLDQEIIWIQQPVFITYNLSLIGLCILFLYQSDSWKYIIAFILLALEIIGAYLKIMHLPGSGIFLGIGLFSKPYIAALLILTVIKDYRSIRDKAIYNIIISTIIFMGVIIVLTQPSNSDIGIYLQYLLLATILTMKLKSVIINKSETNILTVIAINQFVHIVLDTIKQIN